MRPPRGAGRGAVWGAGGGLVTMIHVGPGKTGSYVWSSKGTAFPRILNVHFDDLRVLCAFGSFGILKSSHSESSSFRRTWCTSYFSVCFFIRKPILHQGRPLRCSELPARWHKATPFVWSARGCRGAGPLPGVSSSVFRECRVGYGGPCRASSFASAGRQAGSCAGR